MGHHFTENQSSLEITGNRSTHLQILVLVNSYNQMILFFTFKVPTSTPLIKIFCF